MAAGVVNPVVGAAVMGTSAGGNAYTEMINAGYTKGQARTYAALVGGSEAGLSYLLGGIGKVGGKLTNKVVGQLVDKVDNILGKVAIKLGGKVLSEVGEENLQAILTPWYKELATNVEQKKPGWEEIGYNSLLTAVTTLMLEGGDTVKSVKAPVDVSKAGKTKLEQTAVEKKSNIVSATEGEIDNTKESIAQQLRNNQTMLNKMESVADIQTPKNFEQMSISEKMTWVVEKCDLQITK